MTPLGGACAPPTPTFPPSLTTQTSGRPVTKRTCFASVLLELKFLCRKESRTGQVWTWIGQDRTGQDKTVYVRDRFDTINV